MYLHLFIHFDDKYTTQCVMYFPFKGNKSSTEKNKKETKRLETRSTTLSITEVCPEWWNYSYM